MNHLSDSQLNEYLDGSLAAETRRAVGTHLESCIDCRARLDELQFVFNSLSGLSEVQISHDLTPDILSQLPQKQSRVWTPVFAAQVGAALGMVLWLSSEGVRFIALSVFPDLRHPKFTLSGVIPPFPNLQSLTLDFLLNVPKIHFSAVFLVENISNHFTLAALQNWVDRLPGWHIPLSTVPLTIVTVSALLLCLIVNAALLRDPYEVKK
jgi:Putative zinc-finger